MADLTELQSSGSTKVVGSDASANESNFLNVNAFGSAKVALHDASTNSRQIVDLNGAAKVGEAVILAGDVLYGQALSDLLWGELSINGGSTAGGTGEQTFNTGTTANGEIILQSKKRARFMISQFNIAHFGIQLNTDVLTDPNCIAEWGCADIIDFDGGASLNGTPNGIFIRVQGNATDPVWSAVSVKNGVETVVSEGSWNGAGVADFVDSPSLSVYEMIYNAGTAFFLQGSTYLHRLISASTYAANYNFPVFIRLRNINGSTTDRSIGARAAGTYRLGEERGEVISRTVSTDTLFKTGAGYVSMAYLSRTGSGGGAATLNVYDGVDATGTLIARIDIGADDLKGIPVNSTFSEGLYITVSGTGTVNATVGFE